MKKFIFLILLLTGISQSQDELYYYYGNQGSSLPVLTSNTDTGILYLVANGSIVRLLRIYDKELSSAEALQNYYNVNLGQGLIDP